MTKEVLTLSINEKQILHAILDKPELLPETDIFVTNIGKSFYEVLCDLKAQGMTFISEHILRYSNKNVTQNNLQSVYDTKYQVDFFDTYKKDLFEYFVYSSIEESIIKEMSQEVIKKGGRDISVLKKLYDDFGDALYLLENKGKDYFTFFDMLEEHEDFMNLRSQATKQTSGCFKFDEVLTNIVPGLCVIGGYSGSAKSTSVAYLISQRIIKRLPTIAVNTELSFDGLLDNILPVMIEIPYTDILGIAPEDQQIDYGMIQEKYQALMLKYYEKNNFLMYPKYACSLETLEIFIREARKRMNLSENMVLFCFIDLLSMMTDFNESGSGSTKADGIENGLNKLNEILLSNNVLCIGTVQLKRYSASSIIKQDEDVEKFRPSLDMLKSSGSWEERSRWVLGIHNPYHIVNKNPCHPIYRKMVTPIVELDILKDTYYGKTGKRIKYRFDFEYKKFQPYVEPPETEEQKMKREQEEREEEDIYLKKYNGKNHD
jgi:hypothetical protein